MLIVPVADAAGRHRGTVRRRVRIQQANADGTFLVTAPRGRVTIGWHAVEVPAITRRVTRGDLRKPDRPVGRGARP